MCLKEIGLRAQKLLATLSSIINAIEEIVWSVNEYENVHFDIEYNLYMGSKDYD